MFQNPLAAPTLCPKQGQRIGWYLTEQTKHDSVPYRTVPAKDFRRRPWCVRLLWLAQLCAVFSGVHWIGLGFECPETNIKQDMN
jgi:hypothetical protein